MPIQPDVNKVIRPFLALVIAVCVECQYNCAGHVGRVGKYAWSGNLFGGTWIVNDEVVGAFELTTAYFGEVGGFGMVGAQEAVPVALDGAFLPSAVGMAVVDGDVKEGLKRVFMKEFGAVVGEDGLEFVAIGTAIAAEVPEGVGHGGLGDCWEVVKIKTAGFVWIVVVRVDEREQAAVAVGGVDGVHLEVAGLGMVAARPVGVRRPCALGRGCEGD